MQLEYTTAELILAIEQQRQTIYNLEVQIREMTENGRLQNAKAHCLILEHQKVVKLKMEYILGAMDGVADRFFFKDI
jgi:hypothetical protein